MWEWSVIACINSTCSQEANADSHSSCGLIDVSKEQPVPTAHDVKIMSKL